VTPFVTRTWMYMSGVMYAATNFDRNLPHWAAVLAETNPLVAYIEIARHSLLVGEEQIMSWAHMWTLAIAWAIIASVGGFIYFWRGETEYGRG
jgi:teichoic acid transport system permease protein